MSQPLAVRLARRELRGGVRGFRIFLACLTLGVAAIASVQSISSGIVEGLRRDGQSILGGDVAVRRIYRPADDDQRAHFEASAEVSNSTEMRAMAANAAHDSDVARYSVRIKTSAIKEIDVSKACDLQFFVPGGDSFDSVVVERMNTERNRWEAVRGTWYGESGGSWWLRRIRSGEYRLRNTSTGATSSVVHVTADGAHDRLSIEAETSDR